MSLGPRAWVPPDHENRLAECRTKANMTIAALAEKVGVASGTLRNAELGTTSPLLSNGQVKPWVSKACDELGRLIEDVFPNHFCAWRPDELVPEQIYGDIMRREPQDVDDAIDARTMIGELAKSNRRQAEYLWMWCHGLTYQDISDHSGISLERVRQIVQKGLRYICNRWLTADERNKKDVVPKRTPINEENKVAGQKGIPVSEWPHMKLRWRPEHASEKLPDKRDGLEREGIVGSRREGWTRAEIKKPGAIRAYCQLKYSTVYHPGSSNAGLARYCCISVRY